MVIDSMTSVQYDNCDFCSQLMLGIQNFIPNSLCEAMLIFTHSDNSH